MGNSCKNMENMGHSCKHMEKNGKINGTFMENNGNIWENEWKHMEESAIKQGK